MVKKEIKGKVEEEARGISKDKGFDPSIWKPKTELGKNVKKGLLTDIDNILAQGHNLLETEIVDMLIPSLTTDLIEIGQSKGKFGGGKRSIWRQTQKKSKEGNKPSFGTMVIVGSGNGHVGLGTGKAKETLPAREKATRRAKLNMISIKRGCGSWECGCGEAHSIPYKVTGKCGSVIITLMPAAKGTGLKCEKECQKILKIAGIKDVYAKSRGSTKTKANLAKACFAALKNLTDIKVQKKYVRSRGIVEGRNA